MGSCLPVVPKDQGEHPCLSVQWLQAGGDVRSLLSRPFTLGGPGTIGMHTWSWVLLTLLVFDVQVLAALNLSLTHI